MSRKGTSFIAYGEGFDPNEQVVTVSRSNGEQIRSEVQAKADGTLVPTVLFPAAVGRQHKAAWVGYP